VHHADKLAHDWKTSYLLLALDKEVFAELIGGPACVDPGPLACPRKLAIVISQKKKKNTSSAGLLLEN
jgi:hypothetical protein